MTYPLEANSPITLSHLQGHSILQAFRCDFCPRDAIRTRYRLSSRVRLSVRLSVTRQSCIQTATCRITQTTQHNSQGLCSFMMKKTSMIFRWNYPNGSAKDRRVAIGLTT